MKRMLSARPCTIRPAHTTDKWRVLWMPFRTPTQDLAKQSIWLFLTILFVAWLGGFWLFVALLRHSSLSVHNLVSWTLFTGLYSSVGWLYARDVIQFLARKDWSHLWLAEQRQSIVAYAKIQQFSGYSVLDFIYVAPRFRQQGIDAQLLHHLTQRLSPIYVFCLRERMPFFQQAGFRCSDLKRLPGLPDIDPKRGLIYMEYP